MSAKSCAASATSATHHPKATFRDGPSQPFNSFGAPSAMVLHSRLFRGAGAKATLPHKPSSAGSEPSQDTIISMSIRVFALPPSNVLRHCRLHRPVSSAMETDRQERWPVHVPNTQTVKQTHKQTNKQNTEAWCHVIDDDSQQLVQGSDRPGAKLPNTRAPASAPASPNLGWTSNHISNHQR